MIQRLLGLTILACALLVATPIEAREPRPTKDAIELGLTEVRSLIRIGRIEDALTKLGALHQANPNHPKVVLEYGRRLSELGRLQEAIALYRTSLASIEEAGPILIDLERLYREAGDWDQALAVCLEYQTRLGDRGQWVENEVESLIRSDRLGKEAVEQIGAALRSDPKEPGLGRLWILALFHAGQSERALNEATALDQTEGGKRDHVYRLSMVALDKNAFTDALLAFDVILAGAPTPGRRDEVLYRKAQVQRKLRRLDECLATFDQLLASGGDGKQARSARLEKAQILAHELHRRDEALRAYQDLLSSLRPDRRKDDAELFDDVRLAMAECHVLEGRPDAAAELYAQLADSSSSDDVRSEAMYQQAEMLFYQGEFDPAQEAYYKLTDLYPRARWVNDALQRILQLGENRDQGGAPLEALAQAAYQRRLGYVEKALGLVREAIEAHPGARAVDDLWLARVALHLDLGRTPEARAAADTLAAGFPASPLAPRALRMVADAFARDPRNAAEADALYERIVLQFPQSIEAPAARASLKGTKAERIPRIARKEEESLV